MDMEKSSFQRQEDNSRNNQEGQQSLEFQEHSESNKGDLEFKPDIRYIENTSRSALFEQSKIEGKSFANKETEENKHEGLNEEEKVKIKEEHPDWLDEVIDAIGSWKEYEIYNKANLKLEYIDGKPCLVRTDIDWEQKDSYGRINRERTAEGLAPLDKNGRPLQLHHIGQRADSPLAELTFEEHRCDGNDTVLHDKTKETEVHGDGSNWDSERQGHWKERSASGNTLEVGS